MGAKIIQAAAICNYLYLKVVINQPVYIIGLSTTKRAPPQYEYQETGEMTPN